MVKMLLNEELRGIELYFDEVPTAETREALKASGYRWHKVKKCWYAKQSEETTATAQKLTGTAEATTEKKTVSKLASLWERCQVEDIPEHEKHLSTKEISEQTRKHIKERFPEIRFSCRIGSGGWAAHNEVNFYFKSAPYAKDSVYFEAIKNYVKRWLWSFNYDNSDSMTDYFDRGFYENVSDWNFEETEPTEAQREDMADFDRKAEEAKQAEEERRRAQHEEWQRQREEDEKRAEIRRQKEKRAEIRRQKEKADREKILNEIKVIDIAENEKYILSGFMACGCGKENNIEEVQNEGRTEEESALIKREVHFTTSESYGAFCEMFLLDWDFLSGCGGTGTLDKRVTDDNYKKLNAGQRESVTWILWDCVAVFLNGKLKLIIDPEGFSYARYVNIVCGECEKKLLTDAEKAEEETERNSFYMPDSIQTQAEAVESGNKYTLIYNDPWTLCATMHHITINSITKTNYAQYSNAILINYTERGKKKPVEQYFYDTKKLLLFSGWLDAVPEELTRRNVGGNMYELLNCGASSEEFMQNCAKYYESNGNAAIINTLQY